MRGKILRATLFVVVCGLALEALYRGYLYWANPQMFATIAPGELFAVWDQAMWRYDPQFGYDYPPEREIHLTMIKDGRVTECVSSVFVNRQGNIGPAVPDYDAADLRIVIAGDSMTGSELEGVTWPSFLQAELERATGRTTRIMNIARDGYGVVQMFDLVAARLPELRPHLIIFAFNVEAIKRARTWRNTIGSGDDIRFVSTVDPSPEPDLALSTETVLVVPRATKQWCQKHLATGAPDDPVLQLIQRRAQQIRDRKAQRAAIFDLTRSYVFDRLTLYSAFASQWRKLPPGTNPQLRYADYAEDAQFLSALRAVTDSGTPYLMLHLPLGSDVHAGREHGKDAYAAALLASLERLAKRPLIRMRPYLDVPAAEATKLCKAKSDCHPSVYGMQAYARAAAKIIAERAAP